jgi:hypothetical protein
MFNKFTDFAKKNNILFFLLLLALTLRIPNFFEPYWYGDEAIYLAVGTGIRNGLKLYTDIIDHKTPIIYYLATTPTQLQFRFLNVIWMLVTTSFFYFFAKSIFKGKIAVFIASLTFILLTTLPMLEGNIPNGELFVMGFVLAGGLVFSKSQIFKTFINNTIKIDKSIKKDFKYIFIAGIFLGLGILTKVPGILDLAAFMTIGWFALFNNLLDKKSKNNFGEIFTIIVAKTVILFLGALFPILLSILYYIVIGSGQDYLDYGLLYNIRYSGSWKPNFESELVGKLFTLPGKAGVVAIIVLAITFLKKYLSPRFQFLTTWLVLSFFAALLSNRPYPHYILQLIPSFSLLVGHLLSQFIPIKSKISVKFVEWGFIVVLFFVFIFVKNTLEFSTYPTRSYYERFHKLATGKISKKEYDESFNGIVKDNYEATEFINSLQINEMFIWGTNPMLYAQTQTTPTSRFTVAFHIKDFDDYDRTFDQIQKSEPKVIVVMKNEQTKFEKLEDYLNQNYRIEKQYQSMDLYLKNDE